MPDLACAACRYRLTVTHEVPSSCPICGHTKWDAVESPRVATVADPVPADPAVPYVLNENDRRLLQSLRIAADEPVS
jgi:hypothetical protein